MKYYFQTPQSERAYTLAYHIEAARKLGLPEIALYEAIPVEFPGFFWCRHSDQMGEAGVCGADCEGYTPKNGRSGCCRHYSKRFFEVGNVVVFQAVGDTGENFLKKICRNVTM